MSFNLAQFLVVALAHCLALLSPGPDFFLLVRARVGAGLGAAVCLGCGIAAANGFFIALAIGGVSLLNHSPILLAGLKWTGCLYLLWLGILLLRSSGQLPLDRGETANLTRQRRLANFAIGFLSALLNPKNSLFYTTLFGVLVAPATPFGEQVLYGCWMFLAVLVWDIAIAFALGHPAILGGFQRRLRIVERTSGVVLLGIALGVALKTSS